MVVASPSNFVVLNSGVSKAIPPMVPSDVVPFQDFFITSSYVDFSLGVSRTSCDGANFKWKKDASLVEDGWTTVKGKKFKPSNLAFDMTLQSNKKGSKGKVSCGYFFGSPSFWPVGLCTIFWPLFLKCVSSWGFRNQVKTYFCGCSILFYLCFHLGHLFFGDSFHL